MKLLKILAVIMAVCLLGAAFIACDGGKSEETTAAETTAKTTVEVTLIIKDGSSTKYEGTTICNGTLGHAIEMFCAGEFEDEFEIFDPATNLLVTIGELKSGDGKSWKAYYEDQGQSKEKRRCHQKDQPEPIHEKPIIQMGNEEQRHHARCRHGALHDQLASAEVFHSAKDGQNTHGRQKRH